MSLFEKFKPTRDDALASQEFKRSPRIVADLDALISEPIAIKFRGKMHNILPVTTQKFAETSMSLGAIQDKLAERDKGKPVTDDELYGLYLEFFNPLCPTITLEDIKSMAIAQLHALIHVVVKHLVGGSFEGIPTVGGSEESKKKTLKE